MVAEIEKLTAERKKLGISRAAMSRLLKCPEVTLRRWEKGTCRPSPQYRDKIKRLLKALNSVVEEMHRNG
jgi:DNA-binding transcriptional regulator YiaG